MTREVKVDQELYKIFIVEAHEQLEKFTQALLLLEKEPENVQAVNELFRIAHTLKGTSGMVGFDDIKEGMHAAEDLLDAVRAGRKKLTSTEIDLLLSLGDAVVNTLQDTNVLFKPEDWVGRLRGAIDNRPEVEERFPEPMLILTELEKQQVSLLQEQGKMLYGFELDFTPDAPFRSASAKVFYRTIGSLGEVFKTAPTDEELIDENYCKIKVVCNREKELTDDEIQAVLRIRSANPGIHEIRWRQWTYRATPKPQEREGLDKAADTIRVDSEKLQKLLNTVGDLISIRAGLDEIIGGDTVSGYGLNSLKLQMHQFNQSLSLLQSEVMKLRMVPIKQLFTRYPRIVRDLSQKCGKEIELVYQGEGTEIDKKVMELLVDPLTHIIRNAVDHGIEDREERMEKNKPTLGRIVLKADQEGSNIVIEVMDDGAGIDLEKVRAKAISVGIAQEGQVYTEEEIIEFLFKPGFSTADKVTDVSGRGVGLDVVRTNLNMVNGSISIQTKKDAGSTFRLVVPLTLAIINAFLVRVAGTIFAVPSHDVIENIVIGSKDIHRVEGAKMVRLRDDVIPLVDMGELFYDSPAVITRHHPVVIVEGRQKKAGLIVDEFLEPREIMIKPVNPSLGSISHVSGVTVLGNGQVALIMDVYPVLESYLQTVG